MLWSNGANIQHEQAALIALPPRACTISIGSGPCLPLGLATATKQTLFDLIKNSRQANIVRHKFSLKSSAAGLLGVDTDLHSSAIGQFRAAGGYAVLLQYIGHHIDGAYGAKRARIVHRHGCANTIDQIDH